jgi:hypothetical protein
MLYNAPMHCCLPVRYKRLSICANCLPQSLSRIVNRKEKIFVKEKMKMKMKSKSKRKRKRKRGEGMDSSGGGEGRGRVQDKIWIAEDRGRVEGVEEGNKVTHEYIRVREVNQETLNFLANMI